MISIFIVSFDLYEHAVTASLEKQMGTILLRYQPSVTCNSRTTLKSTFNFTEIVNEWKWKRGTVCHYVRFISHLS